MSKRNRERRASNAQAKGPKARRRPTTAGRPAWHYLIGLAVIAVVAASFALPKLLRNDPPGYAGTAAGIEQGTGLPAGSTVPTFSGKDVITGRSITSQSVYGHKTLLFFSEGVMCQACFQQIQGLEQVGNELEKRGIQLVSITNDPPSVLKQAIAGYGIKTPMISDENRDMSRAFNTLGKGMHADTPGHAFVLIDRGKVLWQRDYWLPPHQTMYVPPKQLLRDIPAS